MHRLPSREMKHQPMILSNAAALPIRSDLFVIVANAVSVYVGNVPTHDSAFLNDKTWGIIVVMIAAIIGIVILGLHG